MTDRNAANGLIIVGTACMAIGWAGYFVPMLFFNAPPPDWLAPLIGKWCFGFMVLWPVGFLIFLIRLFGRNRNEIT